MVSSISFWVFWCFLLWVAETSSRTLDPSDLPPCLRTYSPSPQDSPGERHPRAAFGSLQFPSFSERVLKISVKKLVFYSIPPPPILLGRVLFSPSPRYFSLLHWRIFFLLQISLPDTCVDGVS